MVIEMNIPGFTAETSLHKGKMRYETTSEATIYGGLVQPASPFSDSIDLDREWPYLSRYLRWNCLKRVCIPRVVRGLRYCEWRWVRAVC